LADAPSPQPLILVHRSTMQVVDGVRRRQAAMLQSLTIRAVTRLADPLVHVGRSIAPGRRS